MLTSLQQRAVRVFFDLPESEGFALVGGAALLAHGVGTRPTRDLDLFTEPPVDVAAVAAAYVDALKAEGLGADVVRSGRLFARLVVTDGGDALEIDLATDSLWLPVEQTELGPVKALREVAADKVLALFGRAAARDFVDVWVLAQRFSPDDLLEWAAEKDAGFDRYVLAEMIGMLERHPRAEYVVDDAGFAAMERFYRGWRAQLIDRSLGSSGERRS
jgi:Nucleotidyl transferase AbiEii toxin, Type IV TA system